MSVAERITRLPETLVRPEVERPTVVAGADRNVKGSTAACAAISVRNIQPWCPCVGALTAITFVTTINDPAVRAVVRGRRAPGSIAAQICVWRGRPERADLKCGNSLCRTTLYQASLGLLTRTQRWSSPKAWGMAVAKRRGMRRAVVDLPPTRRTEAPQTGRQCGKQPACGRRQ
jgi:hypothetical protein